MISIAIFDDEPKELERAKGLLKQYAFEHPQYDIKSQSFSATLELLTYVSEKGGL